MDVEAMLSNSQGCGLTCMHSQRDITVGGSAYAAIWQKAAGYVRLLKMASGLTGTQTVLASAPVSGSVLGMRLAWSLASDNSSLSLILAAGTAEDYSDLMTLLTYQDATPLTAHVTEGGFYNDGGAGQDFSVRFDLLTMKA
jgi:hypothetical protein